MLPRTHGATRLDAFSDAAFAFALTLLVVSLGVPRSYDALIGLMWGVPSFACCFGILSWIWYEHAAFFRRYSLQDPLTVTLNCALLFVVLFYVYPLKFMLDSMFAQFLPQPIDPVVQMSLSQLGNASAIYGFGFFVLFVLFALLYRRAYARRQELGLDALDLFDLQTDTGHHLVSAANGLLVMVFALVGPLRFVFVAPMLFALMGPAHAFYQSRRTRRRQALAAAV